jgi:hypothetical protein
MVSGDRCPVHIMVTPCLQIVGNLFSPAIRTQRDFVGNFPDEGAT